MIVPMAMVRIMGPRGDLDATLDILQDTGMVHLVRPTTAARLEPVVAAPRDERQARYLTRFTREYDRLAAPQPQPLPPLPEPQRPTAAAPATRATTADFARWIRLADRLGRETAALEKRTRAVVAERAEIARFEQFVQAFRGLLPKAKGGRLRSYQLILRGEDPEAVPRLRDALAQVLQSEFALESSPLASGELAALLLVPPSEAPRVERLLVQSGIHELPLPNGVAAGALVEAVPALAARREALDAEAVDLDQRRRALLDERGPELAKGRAAAADRLLALAARSQTAATSRSFVIEGWTPAAAVGRLVDAVTKRAPAGVVVEEVGRDHWRADDAPVVLANPRLFRPFEALTSLLPLPKYGSIDPTPFTAVFFPMFFGLMLGDVGYGAVLAVLALVLRARSAPGSVRRSLAEVFGAGAAFAIAFGFAFGELFGDLGRRWFGLEPVVFDREEALLPFLALALAIGFVHVALGLVLGIVNAARGHPRLAVGRSAALVMLVVVAVALLAAFEVLPRGLVTPAVVVAVAAFPVLVIAEGIVAPIELLGTVSNVLSYARIMALGTASVMMAVVANRLAGGVGSLAVGVVFGLLFHLVNFVLGVFAPTVHALRLHYVEFFNQFYSPGGARFAPFGHWRPDGASGS